jgi:hypothetical protein
MNPTPPKVVAPLPVPVAETAAKYFGKYRGIVESNSDPMLMGRIIVTVPAVLGLMPSSWALPCVPYVSGSLYKLPPVGTHVWVEFEQGNADSPIWSGCWAGVDGVSLFAEG